MKEILKIGDIPYEQKYIKEYNAGHDNIQMEYFIVWNNHTDYGRYKQAIAEYNTNYNALLNNFLERKKNNADIKIIEAEIEELHEKESTKIIQAKIERKQIDIEEKQIANQTLEKQIQRNYNEFMKMLELIKKYETLIEWKDIKELEIEYHTERLKKLFALHSQYWGWNISWVIDVASSLPLEIQKNILPFNNLKLW